MVVKNTNPCYIIANIEQPMPTSNTSKRWADTTTTNKYGDNNMSKLDTSIYDHYIYPTHYIGSPLTDEEMKEVRRKLNEKDGLNEAINE